MAGKREERAQRTARATRGKRIGRQERAGITRVQRARERYLEGVLNGSIPEPEPGTAEARSLARMASLARWGRADPRYQRAWSKYFYHIDDVPEGE
jgi:hypothetical protein